MNKEGIWRCFLQRRKKRNIKYTKKDLSRKVILAGAGSGGGLPPSGDTAMSLAGRIIYIRGGCYLAGYGIIFCNDSNVFPGNAGSDGCTKGIG